MKNESGKQSELFQLNVSGDFHHYRHAADAWGNFPARRFLYLIGHVDAHAGLPLIVPRYSNSIDSRQTLEDFPHLLFSLKSSFHGRHDLIQIRHFVRLQYRDDITAIAYPDPSPID